MMSFLLDSGLLGVGIWLAGLGILVVMIESVRARRGTLEAVLGSSAFAAILALAAAIGLGLGLFKAVFAPRDLLQDIVSAREFLAGRSMYPDAMNKLMREAMAEGFDPVDLLPGSLRERVESRRETTLGEHWVQAHPPAMTLLVAPFVAVGVLFAQSTMIVASLLALAAALHLISRRLNWNLSRRHLLVFFLVGFSFEPVVVTLRAGQCNLLLLLLMVLAWEALHRGKQKWAGVAVGLAASLKMFPGLLLLYFLCRQRRAFVTGAMTVVACWLGSALAGGPDCIQEYRETAQEVIDEYESFAGNVSMLALLTRPAGSDLVARAILNLVFYAFAGAAFMLAACTSWSPARKIGSLDDEFGLCLALMVLFSPITWDHYLAVLILPLCILGTRALSPEATSSERRGFLILTSVLMVPETTYTGIAASLPTLVSNLVVLPLRTYALVALCLWLGVRAFRSGRATSSLVAAAAE